MPKVASDKTLSTETECQYPTEFPATAVEDLRRFAKSGAWLTNRTVVARDIWLLEGWANAVLIDDEPLGTSVNVQTLFARGHPCRRTGDEGAGGTAAAWR